MVFAEIGGVTFVFGLVLIIGLMIGVILYSASDLFK